MMRQSDEKGFILATALVMMLLMTMLTAAVFISVDASQKSSMSAESSAEAFYYAETAIEYMKWSLDNDVEFDSYTYPNVVRYDIVDTDPCVVAGVAAPCAYKFGEPDARGYDPTVPHPVTGWLVDPATGLPATDPYVYLPNADVYGDYTEWRVNRFNPSGNNAFSFSNAGVNVDIYGQLMYYDNSLLADRIVSYQTDDLYTNGAPGEPAMFEIHTSLPRYIMLSIDDEGNIAPSMPPVNNASPWHNNAEGVDYPTNGAIVWLTGGNRTDDYEITPMDTYAAPVYNSRVTPGVWDSDLASPIYGGIPCTLTTTPYSDPGDMQPESVACLTSGAWVDDVDYGLIIYAIGYVRGQPQRLVRVVYKR